jgi:hypothetical protein
MSQELISTLIPIALIGVIALVVGAIAGFLLASLSGPAAPAAPRPSKQLVEAARLWRDRRSDKVSVEMDGKIYASAAELNAEQRATLAKAVDELQLWLSSEELMARALGSAQPGVAASAPLPEPSPRLPAELLPLAPPPPIARAGGTPPPVVLPPGEAPVKPPSLELGDILSRVFTTDKGASASKLVEKSIAAQVDEIVQERLPGSPFKNHLISVTDLPGGGLLVKVDGTSYEGIGDVPDPEIRTFLRECVTEWETRTENSRL